MAAPGVQQLILDNDPNRNPTSSRVLVTNIDNLKLTAATDKSWTIPAGTNKVLLKANADCWVLMNAAAVIPVADVIDGTGSEYIPAGQATWISFLSSDLTLHVIAAGTPLVSLTRYSN